MKRYEENRMDTVNVEIDITDSDFIVLARLAHERNITFNELVNDILRIKVEKEGYNESGVYRKSLHDPYIEDTDLQSGFTLA